MKKEVKKENKSIISSIFTDEQLKRLDFSEEEIEIIEEAALIRQAADVMPNSEAEMDAFFQKLDETFPPSSDMAGTFNKYMDLMKTDPKFFSQIVAMNALLDTVEDEPEAKTEKISVKDIKKEKAAVSNEQKQAKLARVDEMLKSLAEGK